MIDMLVIDKVEQDLKIEFVVELMKLPLDEKTDTIKFDDVKEIINRLCKELNRKNPAITETLEIMHDKEIMKRFGRKCSGKNIPLKEMKKRLGSNPSSCIQNV